MHMIEAIVKPERLDAVKNALQQLGVHGLTAYDVRGYGKQLGETESYRGAAVSAAFVHKVMVKVAVPAERSDEAVEAIVAAARSGSVGDGKIFVYPVAKVVRIRTGERDNDAL